MTATMILYVIIVIFSVYNVKPEKVYIEIDTSKIINTVSRLFIGVALDTSLFTNEGLRGDIDLKSERLSTLLRAISPGYFRLGGTSANWLFYGIPGPKLKSIRYQKANIITDENLMDIIHLTKRSRMRLLYDLNANLRFGSEWNPSDAIKLFEFLDGEGFGDNIDWELGNEPNHDSPAQKTLIPPEQVARDFINLSLLLRTYEAFNRSSLVGPDVGGSGLEYFKKVDEIAGKYLHAYTIHHYYFDGRKATPENYTDPTNFAKLETFFSRIHQILNTSDNLGKPIWLGETSSGYGSGTRGVSDRYVSGFLYLDKLGYSAANNISVVIRQTIFNGHYGLIDFRNFDPHPDYWLTWVHHQLVDNKVFKVDVFSSEKSPKTTRVYAQCTKNKFYSEGSVTLFALNVHPTETKNLYFKTAGEFEGTIIHAYIMRPVRRNVLSKDVMINGELMRMRSKGAMPILPHPKLVKRISLPPLTFGFFVFPRADVDKCHSKF